MTAEKRRDNLSGYLLALASLVIIVAGMKAAKSIIIPMLLAAFVGVVLTPPLHWLQRMRVPTGLALLIIAGLVGLLSVGVVTLVGQSLNDFLAQLPVYQARLDEQTDLLDDYLAKLQADFTEPFEPEPPPPDADGTVDGVSIDGVSGDGVSGNGVSGNGDAAAFFSTPGAETIAPPAADPTGGLFSVDRDFGINLVRSLFTELGGIFSNALVLIVTLIFMLLEASRFPEKLEAAFGSESPSIGHVREIIANVRRYMGIKTATSCLTGLLVAVFLTVYGINYPLLWGLLAFLFNYVPNIGSIIAAVPAVALALVQRDLTAAAVTATGYVAINFFISYAIEPRFMGQGLGLSTLVVFVSLVFWGWVLGPIGMLLSAPLTMILKIVLSNFEETEPIAVLLGVKAPEP